MNIKQNITFATFGFACLALGVWLAPSVRRGLTPSPSGSPQTHTENTSATPQLYQSGMHPWIISTKPGNCPICGMKMEPIDPAKLTGEVTIDPTVVQNLGVRTSRVVSGPAVQTLRTVGTVEVAEPNVHDVNLRVSGWIEALDVNFVGAQVNAGDTLFTLYSPQLYAAQEEFLLAQSSHRSDSDDSLLNSARDRLLNFGLTSHQIEAIAQAGTAQRNVSILSPAHGTVIDKHANAGMNVEPGMRVFRIADLSRVWVQVAVYESQLAGVQIGQSATMTVDALPGETFKGEVAFVDPTVDPQSRTARVRLAFDNPGDRLKPGLFANVTLTQPLAAQATLVLREAVIDTGTRQIVFVALGQGRFEPREVALGAHVANDHVVVTAGLVEGEKVVSSGQFLLDSEASMRASLARRVGANTKTSPLPHAPATTLESPKVVRPPVVVSQKTDHPTETAKNIDKPVEPPVAPLVEPTAPAAPTETEPIEPAAIDTLITAYLALQQGLTQNTLDESNAHLKILRAAATQLVSTQPEAVGLLAKKVVQASHIHADDLAAFRTEFETLSTEVIALVQRHAPSSQVGETLRHTHCPMVNADWLQLSDLIENPYDPAMLRCGVFQSETPLEARDDR
ncbi:MAG: efflux RND transporter periplasmic adaptor subunit [Algisphaera sp.]